MNIEVMMDIGYTVLSNTAAMGRAIVRNPKVFLFDEPLSNLDAKLRVQMRSEIKALHQRLKTTTVYVTHDQIEAMTMAPRRRSLLADRRHDAAGLPAGVGLSAVAGRDC